MGCSMAFCGGDSPDVAVAVGGYGELGTDNALARVGTSLLHDRAALGVQGTPPDPRAVHVQRNFLAQAA